MVNSCTFTGNAGRDAEIAHTSSGKPVVSLSIAMKSGWGDNAVTIWTKVRVWGKQTDWAQNIKSGDRVLVANAEYTVETYEKDGEEKKVHMFVAGMGSSVNNYGKMTEKADAPAPENSDDNLPF